MRTTKEAQEKPPKMMSLGSMYLLTVHCSGERSNVRPLIDDALRDADYQADANKYGLEATQVLPSVFEVDSVQYNLTSPTLNITTSYTSASLATLSGYLQDITTSRHGSKLDYVEDITPSAFWTYRNETYSWAYMLDHTSCRYSEHHSWGFSFLILFITSLLLSIWSIGTYSLWLYVQLYDQKQSSGDSPRTLGIYSSGVDLAHALKNDFGNDEIQPGMKESDIRTLIRRRGKATLVGVASPLVVSSRKMQEATMAMRSPGPGFEENNHPVTLDRRSSRRAWNKFTSLLWPKTLSLPHTLPYQPTSSSQAHMMHWSHAEPPPVETSSVSSITDPSTKFDFSATIPPPDLLNPLSQTTATTQGRRTGGRSRSSFPSNDASKRVEPTSFEFKRDLGDD